MLTAGPKAQAHTAHLRYILLHCGLRLRLRLGMGCGLSLECMGLCSLPQALGLGLEAVCLADSLLLRPWAGLVVTLRCQAGSMGLRITLS